MNFQTPDLAAPGAGRVRDYLPSREQGPLLVAALGTLLLTTADIQPLLPSQAFASALARPAGLPGTRIGCASWHGRRSRRTAPISACGCRTGAGT